MRIVHVCVGFIPRKLARNGGELRYWQNLASLVALGHEVHLVICGTKENIEPEVRQLARSVQYVGGSRHAITWLESWRALIDPQAALEFYIPSTPGFRDKITQIALKTRADMIWADWIGTMAAVPSGIPVVYSHHDFHYKIMTVRWETQGRTIRWPDRLRHRQLRRAELSLCKKANHVVCVSASETQQLRDVAQGATYVPIVGPTVSRMEGGLSSIARVFLFGTWACTAMRSAGQHLRTCLWPLLQRETCEIEWIQLGKPEPRETEDWKWVRQNFVCHGFVEDLATVFRLGDASLVPYTEDSGFRTKFVTAAAYGVVNIGYESTFACAPEFTHGKDCLIAKSSEELVHLVKTFSREANLRKTLGEGARTLYERVFSFESQLPKYDQVLSGLRRHP